MKILAISWASHTEVNRQIFRVLSAAYNLEVTIIIPRSINIDGVPVGCDPYTVENIDIIALDVTNGNPRFNRYIGINSVIAKIKPDIIFHEDDPISLQAIQYGLLCRVHKAKLICRTNQNTDISYAYEIMRLGFLKGALYAGMKLSMFWMSRRLISHIFSISEDGSSIYKKLGFQSVTKIPLGLDEETFRIDDGQREKIRQKIGVDHLIFGYFGRAIEGKGLHLLLEALSKLKQYSWSLLLDESIRNSNDDYHQKVNGHLKQWQLEDRVFFFKADHREIAGYMNAADVAVVPSITTTAFKEQYGRVAPEAMACGCLVIASNSGSLPELVDDAGWIFYEGNIWDLAHLLKQAIETKDLPSKGIKASNYARKYLGVSKQAEIMMTVFNAHAILRERGSI